MRRFALATVLTVFIGACAPSDEAAPAPDEAAAAPGVVEVIARGLTLDAPDEIPSGWTTFRFMNESPMTHFVLVERVPDGQGIASQQAEVAPVFQDGLSLLTEGEVDAALQRFGDFPGWFGEIVFMGGPGLTGPGRTSQATMFLEPGTYLLECYVKTGGVFHSYNPDPSAYGMVHELTVTGEASDVQEPDATLQIRISSEGGIEMEGTPAAGEQTVAVHFVDQTVHENFVGHDVHLVRLTENEEVGTVEAWMDWTQPSGLQTPAPAPFLGGINEMPAGATGYFTVRLEPGEYAWVSEVPNARKKGMLKTFGVGS
jgi:hypothetical protein